MQECEHIEKKVNLDGNIVERPWDRIFCPDCGKKIVTDYKATPFKLQGR